MDAATFSALAEPNRLRIVELLRDGPSSVGEIAQRLSLRQPQTSKHLRTLTDAGLVVPRQAGQRRVYELQPQPFRDLDRWLDRYRPTWDERLDSMQTYLTSLRPDADPAPSPSTPEEP
jgi:DNA-binding transcriptional ArsR family regulator